MPLRWVVMASMAWAEADHDEEDADEPGHDGPGAVGPEEQHDAGDEADGADRVGGDA